MKRSIVSLLTASALIVGMVSCSGGKKAKEDAAKEEAAVIAGNVPKSLLTEELKTETIRLLNDMPESDLPYRISSGEVTIGVGNLKYMLPVAKAGELTTPSQKARACGMYFSDYNVLIITGQPTTEVEAVLTKLTADLNISYVMNTLKEAAPAKNATKEDVQKFYADQENKIVKALADDDKLNLVIELLAGASAEYACLMANPSLVVKGDATTAGLSENMERRVVVLGEITADLSEYYPELGALGTSIAPLKEKTATIQTARDANADIMAIRDGLLK
ncbi:hypothetical protein [Parabacteroides sp. PF5-6]|uniref:hypothetical protein n=1 Tax=Parabacteroides sp. PF5-6 TaxID=1742403 RepID=UPI002406CCDA|nr:hypothetical protein [Parabacteroides sp. PF5-6]MDF9828708.1 hypothetical protein [Parabacteroides sp. PF5-6]